MCFGSSQCTAYNLFVHMYLVVLFNQNAQAGFQVCIHVCFTWLVGSCNNFAKLDFPCKMGVCVFRKLYWVYRNCTVSLILIDVM